MMESVDLKLQQRLPSPQGVALAILDACRNDDVEMGEISNLIQTDPALSGRLLEHANAAAMGGRPVISVMQAVNRLGLRAVRQLALGFSLVDNYGSGTCMAFDYDHYWSHSLAMGVAFGEVGSVLKLGATDELFTTGLLAGVGHLGLATAFPSDYAKIVSSGAKNAALIPIEQKFLPVDHNFLSCVLLAQWGIPDTFVQAVRCHEDPSQSQTAIGTRPWLMCTALHLALKIADFAMLPQREQSMCINELIESAQPLGVNEKALGAHIDTIVSQWKVWGEKLKIKTKSIVSFDSLVAENLHPAAHADTTWLRILVVEDDPISRRLVDTWLKDECGYRVQVAKDGAEALQSALSFSPHIVLTDWHMPIMDGLALCQSLRSSEWGKSMYIVMLTSADHERDLVQAFNAGVDDYVLKPINLIALNARLKAAYRYVQLRDEWEKDNARLATLATELALSNRRLQHAALTDPLTELANRRAGFTILKQAWSAATRHGQSLAIMSIDIDHFKAVNDRWGHGAGDAVIQQVATILRSSARSEDTVCRWGGEEFLIISPSVALQEEVQAAQRLRQLISSTSMQWEGTALSVTASFGVASWRADLKSSEQLLSLADEALYASKANGRNRVSQGR